MLTIVIQLAIVLMVLFIGTYLRGIALGIMGGLGLFILVFGFNLIPASPPFSVLLVIMTIITAASVLEAAGGLSYLVEVAAKLIKKHPKKITYISPLITYLFTFLAGSTHVIYSLLPVVTAVACRAGIRPERPLTACVIASHQAIVASPISVATATILSILNPEGVTLWTLFKIIVPASIIGLISGTFVASKLGKNMAIPNNASYNDQVQTIASTPSARGSVMVFFLGIIAIIVLGAFPTLLPSWKQGSVIMRLSPTDLLAMLMLCIAACTILLCKVNTNAIITGKMFKTGMQAVMVICGVAWLGRTFFQNHTQVIMQLLQNSIGLGYWVFALFLFFINIISTSQATTLLLLLPVALAVKMPLAAIVGLIPAVNSFFFLPNYPTMIAAISFDNTGSTRVGKYILNHSFMLPGLTATTSTVMASWIIAKLVL